MSVVANVAINVDSRNAVSQLRQVETRAQATQKAFGALQQAAAAFGAGFALSRVIADVRELDTNLRRLGTVGGDVRALDKGLGDLSKQLDGVANKAELAAASYQALSAGFTDTAGNIKVVEAATKAAVGGLADTTQVTAVLTKTLNAYNMTGSQAIKVTDSISKAIEFGQVEWSDYTSQLGRVASIAAIAGVSLDEVNAFIAASTKNGATAEIAFTGLGATLNSLLQPTKESQDAAKTLGIQWNLAGLQGKGFDGLIAELAQKMGTNQEAAVRLLGSQEALRGAFAAAAKGGKDYRDALEAIGGAAGKTDKDFQAMKTSLENQLKALDTAFKNLSEALGKAFGPTVVSVIKDVTSAVNAFADAINLLPRPVTTAVAEIIKIIAQMVLLQKGIQAIIALRAGFVAAMTGMTAATVASGAATNTSASAFALYTSNARTMQAASIAATGSVGGLTAALLNLAGIGIITVGVNYVVTQTGQILESAKAAGASQKAGTQKALAAQLKGKTAAERKKLLATAQKNLANDKKLAATLRTQIAGQRAAMLGPEDAPLPSDVSKLVQIESRIKTNEARIKAIQTTPIDKPKPPVGGGGGGGAGGGGGTDSKKKDKAAEEEKRLQDRLRGIQIETSAIQKQSAIRDKITQAEIAGDKQLAIRLQGEERTQQILANLQGSLVGITDARERQAVVTKAAAEIDAVQVQTAGELNKLEQDRQVQLEEILQGYKDETVLLQAGTPEIRKKLELDEQIAKLREKGVIKSEKDAQAIRDANAALENQKRIREQLTAQQKMEEQLYQGIANQIAGGVGSAIDAVTQSTKNLGEALTDVGQQILAAVGKMLIFYALAQAFGALGGNDKRGIFSFLAKGFGYQGAANGAYWSGGFQAFADGGMVTRPTMGMIGEGGEAEYVIPASKMRGAMNRYAAGARGASVIPAGSDGGDGMTATMTAPAAIDVRYTVERINSVDYVTADQFQRGMQQAASQGAARGEQRALATLRQNTTQRRRIGL